MAAAPAAVGYRGRMMTLLLVMALGCPATVDKETGDVVGGRDSEPTGDSGDTGGVDVTDTGETGDTEPPDDSGDTGDSGEPPDTGDPEDTGHSGGEDSGDTGEPCRVRLVDTVPDDGAVDHYWRDPVSFELSREDTTATIVAPVAGTTTVDGSVLTFTPDAPLDPSTAYTFTIEGCFGAENLNFTTSAYGTSLSTTLEGRSYALDVASGNITEPEGVGSILASYITTGLLLGVVDDDGASLGLRFAVAVEGASPPEQDMDVGTLDLTADATGSPFFELSGESATLTLADATLDLSDIEVSGTFAGDASEIGGLRLSALVDTRGLVPLVDESGDPAAVCDLFASFGVSCVTCPDGQDYCTTFTVEGVPAYEVSGLSVESSTGTGGALCSVATGGLSAAIVALGLVARRQRRR